MFQLVFKGECTPGTDPATARSNARTLFKATVDQIERMFSGQPVVIRNKLEEVASAAERAAPAAQPQAEPKPAPATPPAGAAGTDAGSGSAVAVEPGDRLPVAGDKVDSILSGSGLTLDPVGVTLEEHREAPAPMFQHLDDWTLAPPGSDLGVKREVPPPAVPDVSHLSLADEDPTDDA